MPEIRIIVTFQAPQYLDADNLAETSENVSSLEWIFDAECRLSEFLAAGLTSSGFAVGPAIREVKITSVAREVTVNRKSCWVVVSYYGFAGDWKISVNSGFLSFMREKTKSAEVGKLCGAIDEILRTDHGIHEIKWQTSDELRNGISAVERRVS